MPKNYPKAPNPAFFRRNVPLPPQLTIDHLSAAMEKTQNIIELMNRTFVTNGVQPLSHYVQMNNFSGIISNIFTNALDSVSPYKNNSLTGHPDLLNPNSRVGIEIKATNKPGKGGEGHNGHSGWHIIACYDLDEESGNIQFVHIEVADLIGCEQGEIDWKLCAGTYENGHTGHIETYMTTPQGTQKLRDGSVYLDETVVDLSRCRAFQEGYDIPDYSPMYKISRSRQSQQRIDTP